MRLIDADALMDDVMERYCKDCDKRKGIRSGKWRIVYEIGDAPCRACSVDDMKDELENAPTIEERRGKWKVVDAEEPRRYGCSQCKCLSFYAHIFCPCCGARMEGTDETD